MWVPIGNLAVTGGMPPALLGGEHSGMNPCIFVADH
jgi:hypothetical protein